MRILYDSKNPFYKDPFGPLKEEQECRVRIRIPESCRTLTVEIRLENEAGRELAFPLEKEAIEGPYGLWSGTFLLSEPGLFFYRFFLHTETTDFSLFKQGYDQTNMEAGEKWQLSCLPKDFHVPGFYAGKVMYQIFPDRFCRAGHVNLHGKLKPYTVHERETETPQWRPDHEGRVLNNDFFGGTLRGIEKKLPYLASLGVSVLYLNPIFKAFSNHRYDTADYKKIDEMLGTERQFRSLCRSAHEYGMRVILDGDRVLLVTEMTKSDSEAILKRDRYEAPRGVYFSIEYVLDAQTFRLLERVEKLHSFGSVQEYSRLTANYDADPPEGISRIRSHMIESELRTVIIITPSETGTVVVSGLARVGDRAEVVVPEGFALYSDPEGKIPFEKETDLRAANTTLYLFPQANKG